MSGESFSSGLGGVRGGVTPRTGFLGVIGIEQRFIHGFFFRQDAPRTGPNLG